MTIYDFLAIVGAGSWLYPIGSGLRKMLTKPKVRVSPAGTVEIGYTSYGPIVNLDCAISAFGKNALIERVDSKITHERGETHTLKWRFIDDTPSILESSDGSQFVSRKQEPALALMVNVLQPSQKRIRFQDDEFQSQLDGLSEPLIRLSKHNKDAEVQVTNATKSKEFEDVMAFFSNYFFWKQGKYTLELQIYVASIGGIQRQSFQFSLAAHEAELLRKNPELIREFWARESDSTADTDSQKKPIEFKWVTPRVERTE